MPAALHPDPTATVLEYVASDGYRLRFRRWPAAAPRRGFVVALHGIQSHSGWYEYSSRRMAEAGFRVDFLDRRGAGLNEIDRGHAPHRDRLLNDVVQFLADLRHERDRSQPDAPIILLAVSWGGKLASVVAARRPELVDGLALLTPGLCPRIRPHWTQRLGLKVARGMGVERKHVRVPLDAPALFTDEARWQRFIADDPLALHDVTVGFLSTSFDLDREVALSPKRIGCPTLLLLAGRDQIIDNAATRRWFARVAATEKRLIEYPLARHTLEFEPDRETIFSDLLQWLDHVAAGGGGMSTRGAKTSHGRT